MKIAQHLAEKVALTAAFVGLGVVLFAAAMTEHLDYDEEQYVAGAYFARGLSVYRDFVSFQPPPYTWIMAAVFDVVGDWYLLTARAVTWVFAFGACALLYSLLASCGTGRVGALALVLGFATSPFTQGPLVADPKRHHALVLPARSVAALSGPGWRVLTERGAINA